MFPPFVLFQGSSSPSVRVARRFILLLAALVSIPLLSAQTNLVQLRSFGVTAFSGSEPEARLWSSSDGFLYGTTPFGGSNDLGTLFRITRDGSGFTVLRQFSNAQGGVPYGGVIQSRNGFLYGTTYSGGFAGAGTIYRVLTNGQNFEVLWHFGSDFGDGANPRAKLLEGSDGFLYGTTEAGGNSGRGTVFRIDREGQSYSVIHRFNGGDADGEIPFSELVEGPNSERLFYGTTLAGGTNGTGTIYRINTDGSNYAVLFRSTDDYGSPVGLHAGLVVGRADGLLYGVSQFGGTNDAGALFRLNRDGTGFTNLFHFKTFDESRFPVSPLLEGEDGHLYGVSTPGGTNSGGTAFRVSRAGTGFQVIRHFGAGPTDALFPVAGLTQVTGALFTVTSQGGPSGDGALVRMATNGANYAVLFGFSAAGGDGFTLEQPVLHRPNGDLFGVTRDGGPQGGGTLYRLHESGTNYAMLHHFGPAVTNGLNPSSPLTAHPEGLFYGTTAQGGASGLGAVYRISTNGNGFQLVRSFTLNEGDGRQPSGSLTLGSDDALYGTTRLGGANATGMVYRVTRNGAQFRVLHSFVGGSADGAGPRDGVVEAADGYFYGVTPYGGDLDWGVLFRVSQFIDSYSVLRQFGATLTDGLEPAGGLLLASDGWFYGATRFGGSANFGTVFRFQPGGGGYAVLHHFTNPSGQGQLPVGALVEGTDGLLYGVTSAGGSFGGGTIYRLAKGGGSFAAVQQLGAGSGGRIPASGLSRSGDSFFGTTLAGGDAGLGTVFRFFPSALVFPPVIAAHPSALITGPGRPVHLSVSASGEAPLSFQWQRDGVDLSGATASNLTFAAAVFTNGANYRAIVSGAGGSVTSGVAPVVIFSTTRDGDTPRLQLFGPAGLEVNLRSKDDLQPVTGWQPFSTVTLNGMLQSVTDPQSGSRSERHFQAVLP